ncbi:phosphatidylglycerol/phosphatidylinositol transfer protein [Coccidioides immitis H538.4]|uniref:Phosphatidylglycerol/phosphatidylinositol transfer protein n=1 Tax=Coccidioides immitis H538.4 TaxID=396776 RepID=A0A0J8RH06_COCIT|nr:phosphatidylglycerol/phosphatidylinositol transfer protein [Coccidioides immitis H538.4]
MVIVAPVGGLPSTQAEELAHRFRTERSRKGLAFVLHAAAKCASAAGPHVISSSPVPPSTLGKTLTIKASGTFSKQVDRGARVLLQVKYGLIRLINQTADLCDQIENVDLHCPLEKGKMTFTKNIDLPKEIPPGTYTVNADVLTKDDEKVTCLHAAVTFEFGR